MKRALFSLVLVAAIVMSVAAQSGVVQSRHFVFAPSIGTQAQGAPGALVGPFKKMYATRANGMNTSALTSSAALPAASTGSLPLWSYSTVSPIDGNTYSGLMVGRSPFFRGKTTTSVTTLLIPVEITISGIQFDPSVADPCVSGNVPTTLTANSPIFQNVPFTMNGVNIGTTQYLDAFQRASFWSQVANTPYHTMLNLSMQPEIFVSAGSGVSAIGSGACGGANALGGIEINAWDSFVTTVLIPALGITPDQFPIFLLKSVVMYDTVPSNCCILGYHGSEFVPGLQTYSPTDFDTTFDFGADATDTAVLAHEVGEWMDDPVGTNPTPAWGHIGQVSGCQNNLEVGDPLSGTDFPIVVHNGFAYHLQELAFYSWFFGGPSIGAGGFYSNNMTFTTPAGPPVCVGTSSIR